jgi:hypothetical protein
VIFDPVGLLHPLQHAGLSRRTPVKPVNRAPQLPGTLPSVPGPAFRQRDR